MNARKHLTIGLALMALSLGLTTTQACAQPVPKGTFELPAAAYWGDTLLQPGQYSIWMSTEVRDLVQVAQIHLSGEGVTKTFAAISTPKRESGRSDLQIADMDGTYVVRAFETGLLGRSFAFGAAKNVRNRTLRASAKPAIAVPVSTGAGS
jgi:hypothetical protein